MYVDSLLEPVLFKEHDEEEISDRVDSDDPESNPIINFRALNLNMVVYNGGIKINNTKADSDVTFSFIVSSRRTKSSAPQIDASGEPALTVSLYNPSGELYATKSADPGSSAAVAFGVPAEDNTAAGEWKMVVDEAHGIHGERVVLAAVLDGLCGVNDGGDDDDDDEEIWDVIEKGSAKPKTAGIYELKSKRGLSDKTFYHQLGDKKSLVSDGTAEKVAFGPLVKPEFVKVWRIDDDLVLDITGTTDRVTVPGWFGKGPGKASVSEIQFADGTVFSPSDLASKAVEREPELPVIAISTDKYIYGTDGDDSITGDAGLNNTIFGGPGNDTMTGNGGSNAYNYRAGWGDDVIIDAKKENEYGILRFGIDIASKDVTPTRAGDDMKFSAQDGSVTVRGWFADERSKMDNVQFADGTTWDARDVEKLVNGEQISSREQIIFAPHLEKASQPEANSDAEDDGGGGTQEGQSAKGSGCDAGAASLAVLACAAAYMRKKGGK